MAKRYRRRPETVEAICYTSQTCAEITRDWLCGEHDGRDTSECGVVPLWVPEDGGDRRAFPGDWIVRHADGALEVLSEQQFSERYEEVEYV